MSIDSEEKLQHLFTKLLTDGVLVSGFTEPDINHQLTSIAFVENESTIKYTNKLKLALK